MYAYHIDRKYSSFFQPGDYFAINKMVSQHKDTSPVLNEYFPEGLTAHGQRYFTSSLNPANPWNSFYETIFEYERKLHFPDKPSRYQAIFALENLDDVSNWEHIFKLKGDEPIWKVYFPDDSFFRADASWFKMEKFDQSVLRLSYNARQYWLGNERTGYNVEPELLIKGPVKLIERVR